MAELGEKALEYHRETGDYVSEKNIDLLITVGEMSKNTFEFAKIPKIHFDTNLDIAKYLKNNAKSGDNILIKGSRCMKMEEILKNYTIG